VPASAEAGQAAAVSPAESAAVAGEAGIERQQTADRVFRGSLAYTAALTLYWLFCLVVRPDAGFFFAHYELDKDTLARVAIGFLVFSILWGVIWFGIKNLLLRAWVGLSKDERRSVFRSRMGEAFDLQGLLRGRSERRIRIADMIGRRGRFITLQVAGFAYLYGRIASEHNPQFLVLFLQDNLFDAVVFNWFALGLYYSSGFLGRMFYGAQSRIMDGTLARANCLLITTLWSVFKFVMVPLGMKLGAIFPPETYAVLFILTWGAYVAADASAEIVGSLFGKQKLRVWGMGEVNRKSLAGTWGGFLAALALCLWAVLSHGLPWPWVLLSVAVAALSTLLELFSPRGTDDFTMATGNALLCWAFGLLVY
jgi:dolichol kinase